MIQGTGVHFGIAINTGLFFQHVLIELFIFVQRFWFLDVEVKLILVRALVAANQCFLLDGSVLLLHFKEPIHLLSGQLGHLSVLQFIQLISVELEIVVLQNIYPLGIRQIHFFRFLSLRMDFEAHNFLLLVHYHCEQLDHLVANALVLFTFNLWCLLDAWFLHDFNGL